MAHVNPYSDSGSGDTPQAKRFLLGLGLVTFCVFLACSSYWSYSAEADYLLELIRDDRSLIVYREYLAISLFGPIPAIAMAAIVICQVVFRDILKRPSSAVFRYSIYGLGGLMFFGLFLMTAGGYFLNSEWDSKFEASGYTECENFVLRFNKNFLNSAWVTDPQFCLDDQLHQILHDNHSRKGFEQAARYLERTYP